MLKCIDTGHTNEITGLCVLHNGNLISASRDDSLKIWNAAAGFALATHIKDMAGRATTSICALTNGRLVSGGFCVPMLKIWNLNNYSDIKTIERHMSTSIAYNICIYKRHLFHIVLIEIVLS